MFDKVLRNRIKLELSGDSVSADDRIRVVEQFIEMTSNTETIAPCFRNLDCWISMLKRLIVRILMNVNVSLDGRLQLYLERSDLWTGTVTAADIQSIKINDHVLLRHTYIILKGLEARRNGSHLEQQQHRAQGSLQFEISPFNGRAFPDRDKSARSVIGGEGRNGKKLRV